VNPLLHISTMARVTVFHGAAIPGPWIAAHILPVPAPTVLRSFAGRDFALAAVALAVVASAALASILVKRPLRRKLQVDQKFIDTFFENCSDSVYFKDIDSRFIRITNSMARYYGLQSPALAIGKSDADIFSAEHAAQALADEQEIMRTRHPMIAKEEKETWPDGRETWVVTTKLPLMDGKGKVVGIMGISHDITDQKRVELCEKCGILYDPVTGLPNRRLLEDSLTQAIATARYNGQNVPVLLIDLDRFKYMNELHGHQFGDRLLEAVAERLQQSTRASDIVGRLCGDEFVVAVSDIPNNQDLEKLARKLLASIAEPFVFDGREVQLTASMGISQFPEDAAEADVLLRYSDVAMYDAKRKGRGRFSFFSSTMTDAACKRQALESDLLNACSRNEFMILYQPIVESDSCTITAMEALLRWKHPTLGIIAPEHFIPLLEELGLMVETGRWVLRTACRQAAAWVNQGFSSLRIAVNVSNQQIYEGNIVEAVSSALREAKLDPARLELELTESRTLDDSEATIAVLRRLKEIGVSLSLDDFGTGWSSLSYLRQFPLDRIKIDRGFVRDLVSQPRAEGMLKSILSMAQNLGFSSIAEGVETSQQRDILRRLRCPEMQGFFFSRPLPAVDATAVLHSVKWGAKIESVGLGSRMGGFSFSPAEVWTEEDAGEKKVVVQ
jgi:diguanylate cyclase (GGDEF)-like protein/PAS domain S-box-containing protein